MSNGFSSFKKEKKLFENWRSFLKGNTSTLLKEDKESPPAGDPEAAQDKTIKALQKRVGNIRAKIGAAATRAKKLKTDIESTTGPMPTKKMSVVPFQEYYETQDKIRQFEQQRDHYSSEQLKCPDKACEEHNLNMRMSVLQHIDDAKNKLKTLPKPPPAPMPSTHRLDPM